MPSPRRMIFSHLKAEPHWKERKQMKQRLIWPVLALAVLLSACGADGKAYTTADAQALIDADAFDGEMEQVDSYTVALLYGL